MKAKMINPEYTGFNEVLRMLLHLKVMTRWQATMIMKNWKENNEMLI